MYRSNIVRIFIEILLKTTAIRLDLLEVFTISRAKQQNRESNEINTKKTIIIIIIIYMFLCLTFNKDKIEINR